MQLSWNASNPVELAASDRDMPQTLTVTCPTCAAVVADDDRACGRCGAELAVWSDAGRTPLILPGNPALSDDMFRRTAGSLFRIGVGSAVGFAAVVGGWFLLREDEGPPPPAIALLAPQAYALPDTEIIKPLPPIPGVDAVVSDTVPLNAPVAPPIERPVAPPPVVAVAPTPAATPTPPTPAEVRTPAPAVPQPARVATAAATPAPSAPPSARVAPPPAGAPAAPADVPVLRLARLVSDSMRTGELLQIRWTVQEKLSGRALTTPVEFTSTNPTVATVDRVRGTVTARGPGRVQIIADGGAAGRYAVGLTVRNTPRLAVSTVPAETLQIGTEAARSLSGNSSAPARVAAPIVSAPAPAPAAVATPVREAARADQLDADDVRTAVNRFLAQVRNGDTSNPGLVEFLADGASHRVALVSPPATISASASVIRVTFEMRLTKFDGGGRPVTRVAPVSMDVEKRQGDVSVSDIAISPLRRQ
jgi:hypothetical protein